MGFGGHAGGGHPGGAGAGWAGAVGQSAPTPTPTKNRHADLHPGPAHRDVTEVPPTATAMPRRRADGAADPRRLPARAAQPDPTAVPPTATRAPRCGQAGAHARAAASARPSGSPAAADPCANIGGDGCNWRVTGGPSSGENGGQEVKLQFMFLHGGMTAGRRKAATSWSWKRTAKNSRSPTACAASGIFHPGFPWQIQLRIHLGRG